MKTTIFFIFMSIAFGITSHAQIKVNSNGRVELDGKEGSIFIAAPRVSINSSWQAIDGINTGLNLFNTNMTNGNWVRMNFATIKSDQKEEDFVTLATKFVDRTVANATGEFHLWTLNKGYFAQRLSITPTSNPNDVSFYFNTGATVKTRFLVYGGSISTTYRGVYLDNSNLGAPTFRPSIADAGYLGSPAYAWSGLYVVSANFYSAPVITSDKRKKKDIQGIEKGVMSKLGKVRGVKYKLIESEYKDLSENTDSTVSTASKSKESSRPSYDEASDKKLGLRQMEEDKAKYEKVHYGFIAQELKEIFPEVVVYDSIHDSYGIMYTEMIPILMEALKEQQAQLASQNDEILALREWIEGCCTNNSNKKFKSMQAPTADFIEENLNTDGTELFQNTPNPFTRETEIKYYLNEGTSSAQLIIHDMQGKEVRSYKLTPQKGYATFTIKASELSAGMYLYSLVADNQIVGTKKMILTK